MSERGLADIRVRADWPRVAGMIQREGGDYFWISTQPNHQRELLGNGQPIPVTGSANLTISQPSLLSETALLAVTAPHRFDEHIDAVLLANETILIGPTADCHVRCPLPETESPAKRIVLTLRGDRWLAGTRGDFQELNPGDSTVVHSLAMTLEET